MYKKLLFIILLLSEAVANDWDALRFKGLKPGVPYGVSIGSGFFVNSDMIVTNRHVVENCINIAVRGAVKPTLVTLHLVDKELDLALLKSPLSPDNVPYLRNNSEKIAIGDILFSIGYPLEKGDIGEYVIKQANVISTNVTKSGFSEIEFTDTVNHGNSGGPLIDKNSNLVGVVTAKLVYKYPEDSGIPDKVVSMAIGVDGLIEFLKRAGVHYASNSTYDIFTNYSIDRLVKRYVVNIHCIQNDK